MRQPMASRPHMPGFGILPFDEGTGLLPWTWAGERLEHSHDYWLATTYAPNFLDPDVNATFRITPEVVFGLTEDDFAGSPTHWTFD